MPLSRHLCITTSTHHKLCIKCLEITKEYRRKAIVPLDFATLVSAPPTPYDSREMNKVSGIKMNNDRHNDIRQFIGSRSGSV